MRARVSIADAFAIGLGLSALGAGIAWWKVTGSAFVDAWVPNIATDLASVALALAVIDRIVKRRTQVEFGPVLGSVYRETANACVAFAESLATHYLLSHIETFKTIPTTASEMFDHWIEGRDKRDEFRPLYPELIEAAERAAARIDRGRETLGELMEPRLIGAVVDFGAQVERARHTIARAVNIPPPAYTNPSEIEILALTKVVQSAIPLVARLTESDPAAVLDLPSAQGPTYDAIHVSLLRARRDTAPAATEHASD